MLQNKYIFIPIFFFCVLLIIIGHDIFYIFNQKTGYVQSFLLPNGPEIYFRFRGHNVKGNYVVVPEFNRTIAGVDYFSFQILNSDYAKDKEAVYFWGEKLKDVDPASFVLLKEFYSKDQKGVYYIQFHPGANKFVSHERLFDADPQTFQELPNDYGKDKSKVYWRNDFLKDVDPASLQILHFGYAKDLQHVYYLGKPVIGADASTFKTLHEHEGYAQDKIGIYFKGTFLKVDPQNFDFPIDTETQVY